MPATKTGGWPSGGGKIRAPVPFTVRYGAALASMCRPMQAITLIRSNGLRSAAVLRAHIGTLIQQPPVQKAKTLDFAKLLDSLQKGSQ